MEVKRLTINTISNGYRLKDGIGTNFFELAINRLGEYEDKFEQLTDWLKEQCEEDQGNIINTTPEEVLKRLENN